MDNPRGLSWRHASVRVTKQIVARLQSALARRDAAILIAVDDDDADDSEPENIIVLNGEKTSLIPLHFRKRLVRVAGEPRRSELQIGAYLVRK